MNDHIALREFIDRILAERDKALALQAREYERRLDELNHSHDEARRVLGTYVTRDVYEHAHEQSRERVEALKTLFEREIATRVGFSRGFTALIVGLTGLSLLLGIIVSLRVFNM